MTALRPSPVHGPPAEPWRAGDAIRAVVLDLVGCFLIVLGWLGAASTARLSHQYAWTAVAVGGLLVAGFGNALWLLAGRRAVGIRYRRLLAEGVGAPGAVATPGEDGDAAPASPERARSADGAGETADTLVIGAGMTRYHRADCMLVRGKAVRRHRSGRKSDARARPCGICLP